MKFDEPTDHGVPHLLKSIKHASFHVAKRLPHGGRLFHAGIFSLLLAVQTGLLAHSATQHSPTYLEPAFLVSGISHWEFGRFEPYRVNPPLVRMVAALPVLVVGACGRIAAQASVLVA